MESASSCGLQDAFFEVPEEIKKTGEREGIPAPAQNTISPYHGCFSVAFSLVIISLL